MQRIAIKVSYKGTHYHGWQAQPGTNLTVEAQLTRAISLIANHPIKLTASGRTDAGVHALEQICHFDTIANRNSVSWIHGCNKYLPEDIKILWSQTVDTNFHARFAATQRTYIYKIYNAAVNSPFYTQSHTWIHNSLNTEQMQKAMMLFVGTYNFNAFRSSQCQAHNPNRTIYEASLERLDSFINATITANAFLHNMVRNIMGMVMLVGKGKKNIEDIRYMLSNPVRPTGVPTAAPNGLYLAKVDYRDYFN